MDKTNSLFESNYRKSEIEEDIFELAGDYLDGEVDYNKEGRMYRLKIIGDLPYPEVKS